MVRKWFVEHPASVGESYLQHQRMALSFALKMIGAGFACLIHAFIPALFVRTGSNAVTELHRRMERRANPSTETVRETATRFSRAV